MFIRLLAGIVITRFSDVVRKDVLEVQTPEGGNIIEGFGQFMPKLIIFIKIKAHQMFKRCVNMLCYSIFSL